MGAEYIAQQFALHEADPIEVLVLEEDTKWKKEEDFSKKDLSLIKMGQI